MKNQHIMNILLIEDDAGLVELITEKLEELGFSVMSAFSGAEALAYLSEQTPDMILLDYSLPDINGKELIETLNKQQTTLPPFIITTGQGDERIAVNMMKLGAMDYLVKDRLFLEKLPEVLKRALKEIESDGKLKQVEEDLKESEKKYRDLISLAQEGIWVIDKNSISTFANPSMAEMLGYYPDEMIGKSLFDFMDETGVKIANENIKRVKAGFKDQRDFEFICKNGDRIFCTMTTAPIIDKTGNYQGAIAGVIDITDRKQAEEALMKSEESIKELIQQTSSKTGQEFFNSTTKTLGGIVKADYTFIAKYIDGEKSVETISLSHKGNIIENFAYELKDTPCYNVMNQGLCVYRSDVANKFPGDILLADMGIEGYIGIPLYNSNNKPQGILIALYENEIEDLNSKESLMQFFASRTETELERHKIETSLKASEERFELAMDATKDGLYDWNLVTNEIYFSPGWKSMLGYKNKELANDVSVFDKLAKPEDLEAVYTMQKEVITKQRDRFELEIKMQHKKGHWLDILSRAEATFDDKGKAIRIVGTHIDITERKHEEKILDIELKLFEYAINHSEEELLQKFLDEAEKLTGSEIGFYHYIEDDQESISLQTWSSNTLNSMCKGSGEASRHYPISKAGVWMDCVKERKPVIHNDYSSLAHKKGLPEGHAPIIRELVVPVIRGNQIMAVLGVGNKKSDYNEADVKSVQRLADAAWETVLRKQAEKKTRIAEENLKNTFDLSPSIICKANLNTGYFIEVNQAVTRILGYTAEEFIFKPLMEFIHPDDRQRTTEEISEQLKGKEVNFFENRYLCKDGSYKWMAWHVTKVDKNGIVTAIGSDISESKLAQLKLVQSTQLLETSQSIAKLGGWELDIATNNLFWTAETYRIHETSPEEFEPTVDTAVGFYLPESQLIISEAVKTAIEKGKGFDLELEVKTTKGRRINVRATTEVILRDGQPIKLTGIFQDITEKRQAEQKIKESEEKYKALYEKIRTAEENLKNTFDLSPSIISKANAETGFFVEANQAVTRILGYSVEEFTSKPLMEFIHPDDKQMTTDTISEQLIGKEVTFFENRYLCKDGSYKWMAWHATKANKNGTVMAIGSDISERKIIENKIVETKQFYENIIEGVQDGIWVTDKNDVIFYANSAMGKIAGVPREQIKGNNVLKDFPEDTTGEFNKFYKQAKKEKKPVWYVVKVTTAANKIVWENGWLIPQYQNKAFNGIICTVRDISERKQAEGKVRKLSTAVQQSPSIIAIADIEGKVEYVNPKFTELTGYSSSDVIGEASNILKSGEQDTAFYKEMWKTIESGEVWRGQFHNKKKNGELFWEAASISAILNESGDIINYIKVGEDITLQKNTETELKIALEKALESDRLKSAFLANMSHEIRTPMNGIRGFINLLNEPNLSYSEINTYTGIINKSSDRLLNTINDIIDLSRIEAGEVLISNTTISIQSVMNELYNFHSPEAKMKGLSLSLEPSLLPDEINIVTDGHKLHGILTNLVKNAIKYTKNGSITFGYSLKNNWIKFFVEDTGIGIPGDRTQAIFNRFEQADIGNRRAFEGAGLGLAISKAYAEMLGGEIWVESDLGKGSVFYFTLPYQAETMEEDYEKNEISTPLELRPTNSLKILIVEDDEVSKELISITVQKFVKEIIIARTGAEAVAAYHKNPGIDLVLMDINMPGMDGYEATVEIRKFNKDIIIIAQTAYALSGDKEKAIAAGCDDYMSKPIIADELKLMINKYVKK